MRDALEAAETALTACYGYHVGATNDRPSGQEIGDALDKVRAALAEPLVQEWRVRARLGLPPRQRLVSTLFQRESMARKHFRACREKRAVQSATLEVRNIASPWRPADD